MLIAFVSVMFANGMYAQNQTKEQEQSNAEKFSAKSGSLMQREFTDVGSVKDCKVSIIYFTDLITNQKQNALKFEYEYVSKYNTDTKSAMLDLDEVDAMIKSIKLIQDKVFPTTPTNYTEVTFMSRDGFQAGCFFSKGNWSAYMKLEKYDKDSYVWLNKEDLPVLLSILEKAKLKM